MKKGFYPRLAHTGIVKNRRFYLPYVITCISMIMMFYILAALPYCPLLMKMRGGEPLKTIFSLGKWVVGIFSFVFLFYTNSFLIQRRSREFGLYNILGMDKSNIGKIIAFESLMIGSIGLMAGLVFGIALYKLAELGLMNVLHEKIDYTLTVSPEALLNTLLVFIPIFLILHFRSLWLVHKARPLELFYNSSMGERPPKANWLIAIPGVIILSVAYYIAVSIESPLSALNVFFVAVVMVIVATYMLFTAGSVTLCRLLQKNKAYYYKKNHFVSVASMVYRMKRNGVGLASICILSTMVLVILSSVMSLYLGEEDSIRLRFPYDISMNVQMEKMSDLREENIALFRREAEEATAGEGVQAEDVSEYCCAMLTGLMRDGEMVTDAKTLSSEIHVTSMEEIAAIYILSLEDYNRTQGENKTLDEHEAMIYCSRMEYKNDEIQIANTEKYKIKEVLDEFDEKGFSTATIIPTFYLVVNDFERYVEPMISLKSYNGVPVLGLEWFYGINLGGGEEEEKAVSGRLEKKIKKMEQKGKCRSFAVESREEHRKSFYELYGGLFFIGVMMSLVFLFGTMLIIYYKQVSEGYEDQSRFTVMQKVGMTKRDIRRSINSQVLTVFFAPLLFAGLHLCFAFPLLWKILQMFNLYNRNLVTLVTIGTFCVFALFYSVVYHVTSRGYYAIVSSDM